MKLIKYYAYLLLLFQLFIILKSLPLCSIFVWKTRQHLQYKINAVWISLLDSINSLSDSCSRIMHFNIEATLKIWFDRVLHRWLYFLRGYQPHQINTLFRYMPCAKRGTSGNSCQPQTGTRASKKTDLIVSSSWCFHFHISFENLVTFIWYTGNVIFE